MITVILGLCGLLFLLALVVGFVLVVRRVGRRRPGPAGSSATKSNSTGLANIVRSNESDSLYLSSAAVEAIAKRYHEKKKAEAEAEILEELREVLEEQAYDE